MIWFTCPHCQVKFAVRDADVNQPIDCPRCQNRVHMPSPVPGDNGDTLEVRDEDCVEEVASATEPLDTQPSENQRRSQPKSKRRPTPPPPPRAPSQDPAVDAAFPEGVPPKVAALGPFLFAISVQSLARPFFHVVGIILLVLSVLLFIPGAICLIPAVQALLKELALLFIVGLAPAFVMFLVGLPLMLATRHNNDWRALFFEDGFVVVRSNSHKIWRYRDISGLYTERIDKRTYMYGIEVSRELISNFTVEHMNGSRFLFRNGCPRNREIGELLQQKTLEWQLPLARQMFERGEEVDFHPFVVSDEGIARGRAFASWDDIDDANVQNGTVYVRGRGRAMFTAKASQVANVLVFMVLAEDVLEGRLRIR